MRRSVFALPPAGARWFARGWLAAGYFFLYVPIVALVLYSFNDSTVPNVWQGFTLKWYRALAADDELLAGLWLSLKIALLTATSAVVLGMTYTYLPFMILPLFSNLAKMDLRLLEAAQDLGATPWTAFWKITVPLSRAGIIAGSMLVFIPCIGEYVIPELLGGPQTQMIGRTLWDEFFSNNDWPMACAVAVTLILLVIVPVAIFSRYRAEAVERRA